MLLCVYVVRIMLADDSAPIGSRALIQYKDVVLPV